MLGEGGNSYLSPFFQSWCFIKWLKIQKSNYKFEPDDKELTTVINNTITRMKTSAENAPEIFKIKLLY